MGFWDFVFWLLVGLGAAMVLFIGYRCIMVVEQDTVHVVKRWGKHHRLAHAGFNLRWIIADQVHRKFSSQQRVIALPLDGVAGGKLPLDIELRLTVVDDMDPVLMVKLAYQVKNPDELLKQRLAAVVRELLLPMEAGDVLGKQATNLGNQIKEGIGDVAKQCGFIILALHITSIRPEGSVASAIIAGIKAAEVRKTEKLDADHRNELITSQAAAQAAAAKAVGEHWGTLLATLRETGLDERAAADVVTALIYQQTAASAAAAGTQVILPAPGVQLVGAASTS